MFEKWKEITERMYPNLVHDIPKSTEMLLTKLARNGMLTTDTCNTTQAFRTKMRAKVDTGDNRHHLIDN